MKPIAFILAVFGFTGLVLIIAGILSGPAPLPPELNTPSKLQSAERIIQAHGFDCRRAEEIREGFLSGLKITCAGSTGRTYHHGMEDRGGRWHVEFRY